MNISNLKPISIMKQVEFREVCKFLSFFLLLSCNNQFTTKSIELSTQDIQQKQTEFMRVSIYKKLDNPIPITILGDIDSLKKINFIISKNIIFEENSPVFFNSSEEVETISQGYKKNNTYLSLKSHINYSKIFYKTVYSSILIKNDSIYSVLVDSIDSKTNFYHPITEKLVTLKVNDSVYIANYQLLKGKENQSYTIKYMIDPAGNFNLINDNK